MRGTETGSKWSCVHKRQEQGNVPASFPPVICIKVLVLCFALSRLPLIVVLSHYSKTLTNCHLYIYFCRCPSSPIWRRITCSRVRSVEIPNSLAPCNAVFLFVFPLHQVPNSLASHDVEEAFAPRTRRSRHNHACYSKPEGKLKANLS